MNTEMNRPIDRSRSREGYNYISDRRFNDITLSARKNGAIILRGGEDVERHLDSVNANASCLNDVLMFRKQVTASEAVEEVRHFEQNRIGLNADKPEELKIILNEIDAKEYIIENAQKYGIPRIELDETVKQLQQLQKMLIETEGKIDV